MKDFPKLMFFAGLLFVSGEGHCSDPVRDSIYLLLFDGRPGDQPGRSIVLANDIKMGMSQIAVTLTRPDWTDEEFNRAKDVIIRKYPLETLWNVMGKGVNDPLRLDH